VRLRPTEEVFDASIREVDQTGERKPAKKPEPRCREKNVGQGLTNLGAGFEDVSLLPSCS